VLPGRIRRDAGKHWRTRGGIVKKEIVKVGPISEKLAKAKVPLSPAVKANGFVFVSGLPPFDLKTGELVKGDISMQTELSLENVKAALEAAGSSLEKVVKVTIYITNAAYFPTVNAIYARYFPVDPPARTFVNVGSWPLEFDIEIECVALA
jgi:reactive intermediate/imine deaminase